VGAIWLYDLPDVLAAAGLTVDVWPGWENRARSSGGYDAVRAVFVHHTASNAAPENDMSYMWNDNGTADQPIGAIYLARDGRLTVGAAGATNTQGKGGPWDLSTGPIPKDTGNAYGIAIEAANGGTGEPWPAAQTAAYVTACRALCNAYGLDPSTDVLAHFEWCAPSCPGRKVDPVGPSPYAAGTVSWDMAAFRRDVSASSPPPIPIPFGDDMQIRLLTLTDSDAQFLAETTSRGVALYATWAGPGSPSVDAAVAAHRVAAQQASYPFEQSGDIAGLFNCVLVGPVPYGDSRHNWDGSEFWRLT